MTMHDKHEYPKPVVPVRPDDDECCHGGCETCVFELYEREMARYQAALKAWEEKRLR
jgi:hypothetical protein